MASGNGKPLAEPKGSQLYEVLKGIDFERRELIGKPRSAGLFDLVKDGDKHRCYACTLCERACPVDCIEIDYCPEYPELSWDTGAELAAAKAAQPEIDMKPFDAVVARLRAGYGIIEAFHTTQETYGYLPRQALEGIASELSLPLGRVYGVATFYSQFRLKPVGKYVIDVCMGTACHVAGAALIVEAFSQELEIPVGETTEDRLFTLQTVNCVGACALAPVVRVGDDETHGRMTPNTARKLVRQLRKREEA
jgi:NADH-quinone oxidoreductase subunit E